MINLDHLEIISNHNQMYEYIILNTRIHPVSKSKAYNDIVSRQAEHHAGSHFHRPEIRSRVLPRLCNLTSSLSLSTQVLLSNLPCTRNSAPKSLSEVSLSSFSLSPSLSSLVYLTRIYPRFTSCQHNIPILFEWIIPSLLVGTGSE